MIQRIGFFVAIFVDGPLWGKDRTMTTSKKEDALALGDSLRPLAAGEKLGLFEERYLAEGFGMGSRLTVLVEILPAKTPEAVAL